MIKSDFIDQFGVILDFALANTKDEMRSVSILCGGGHIYISVHEDHGCSGSSGVFVAQFRDKTLSIESAQKKKEDNFVRPWTDCISTHELTRGVWSQTYRNEELEPLLQVIKEKVVLLKAFGIELIKLHNTFTNDPVKMYTTVKKLICFANNNIAKKARMEEN